MKKKEFKEKLYQLLEIGVNEKSSVETLQLAYQALADYKNKNELNNNLLLQDSNYYDCYEGVYNLILQGLIDQAMLLAIKDLKEINSLPTGIKSSMSFISNLLMSDIISTIWRINFDNDTRSLTLRNFHKLFTQRNPNSTICLSPIDKNIKKKVNTMRSSFLAHLDICKDEVYIKMDEMYLLLEQALNDFNAICTAANDIKIKPINSVMQMHLQISYLNAMRDIIINSLPENKRPLESQI